MNRSDVESDDSFTSALEDAGISVKFFEPNKLTEDEKGLELAAHEIVDETIDKAIKFLKNCRIFTNKPKVTHHGNHVPSLGDAIQSIEDRCIYNEFPLHEEKHQPGESPFMITTKEPDSPRPIGDCPCKQRSPNSAVAAAGITKIQNIVWPTNGTFTKELGFEKVEEYISLWPRSSKWLYAIEFISTDIVKFGTRYIYQVKWSAPTKILPVPAATASVYFTFEVSDFKSDDTQVKISYQYESNQLQHYPDEGYFNEEWLEEILNAKMEQIMHLPKHFHKS